jgi:preprotein translocase subunit SecG
MGIFQLLAVGIVMKFVAVLLVICAVSLIFIILIQKGKGGGLSGTFGGGGAGGLLGSKTGDFLTWATITLVGLFFILLILMAKFYRPTITDVTPIAPVSTQQPASPVTPEQPASPVQQAPAGQTQK